MGCSSAREKIESNMLILKLKRVEINQNHWIYSFVKKNQNKNEEKGNISRKEMRLYDEMRRKSLIRNVLRKSSKKINEKIDKEKLIQNDKGQLNLNESIKDFDKSFNKIKEVYYFLRMVIPNILVILSKVYLKVMENYIIKMEILNILVGF